MKPSSASPQQSDLPILPQESPAQSPLAGTAPRRIHSPRSAATRRSLAIVIIAWMFGSVWQAAVSGAPSTLLGKGVGLSDFQFGLLAAIPFFASLLSLPAGLLIDRTGRRKSIFLRGMTGMRVLWIVAAVVPLYLLRHFGAGPESWAAITFLLAMVAIQCCQAFGGPAWTAWMADVIPERVRGRYFARRREWGIATAIPAAFAVGWILDHVSGNALRATAAGEWHTLVWCGGIFVVAAIFGLIDISLFRGIRDLNQEAVDAASQIEKRAGHVKKVPRERAHLLGSFAGPLRDKQFLIFSGFVATMTFAVSFMGTFSTLYLIRKLHTTNMTTQLTLIAMPAVAQLLVVGVWGKAIDRMGKKPVLAIASLGLVPVGFGWCLMNSGAVWLGYLLGAAGAALWAGVEMVNTNLVMEFASSRQSTGKADDESGSADASGGANGGTYAAVNSVICAIAGCMGGLTSGLIASALRDWSWTPHALGLAPFTFYEVLFLISGVLRLIAAVAFIPLMHEPDAHPTLVAFRFMSSNLYNNMFGVVTSPLRLVGRRRGGRGGKVLAIAPAPATIKRAA